MIIHAINTFTLKDFKFCNIIYLLSHYNFQIFGKRLKLNLYDFLSQAHLLPYNLLNFLFQRIFIFGRTLKFTSIKFYIIMKTNVSIQQNLASFYKIKYYISLKLNLCPYSSHCYRVTSANSCRVKNCLKVWRNRKVIIYMIFIIDFCCTFITPANNVQ